MLELIQRLPLSAYAVIVHSLRNGQPPKNVKEIVRYDCFYSESTIRKELKRMIDRGYVRMVFDRGSRAIRYTLTDTCP